MAHFLCHWGCSHFGALLLDFYFTENKMWQLNVKVKYDILKSGSKIITDKTTQIEFDQHD